MVEGLEFFGKQFADFADQYVLIGGAACTLAMQDVGVDFRATKDLDIVLYVEALTPTFVNAFWQFVQDGAYEIQEKSTGEKQFYRFQKPAADGYPFMLELFSREPDALSVAEGSQLTPISVDEAIASLSAILLDTDYYTWLKSGRKVVEDVPIVGAEHLIPLKAKAWMDLSNRKAGGEKVDSRDVKKHRNDIFRLFAIVDPDFAADVPQQVQNDLRDFMERVSSETIDMKQMGLGSQSMEDVLKELRRIYQLD